MSVEAPHPPIEDLPIGELAPAAIGDAVEASHGAHASLSEQLDAVSANGAHFDEQARTHGYANTPEAPAADDELTGDALSRSLDDDLARLHDKAVVDDVYARESERQAARTAAQVDPITHAATEYADRVATLNKVDYEADKQQAYNDGYFDTKERLQAEESDLSADDIEAAATKAADEARQEFEDTRRRAHERRDRQDNIAGALKSDWNSAVDILDKARTEAERTGDWTEFDGYFDNNLHTRDREAYTAHVEQLEAPQAAPAAETTGRHAAPDEDEPTGRHSTGDRSVIERIMAERAASGPDSQAAPEPDGFRESDFASLGNPDDDIDLALDDDDDDDDPFRRRNRHDPDDDIPGWEWRDADDGHSRSVRQPVPARLGLGDAVVANGRAGLNAPAAIPEAPMFSRAEADVVATPDLDRVYGNLSEILPPAANLRPQGVFGRVRDAFHNLHARYTVGRMELSREDKRKGLVAVLGVAATALAVYGAYKYGHDHASVIPTPNGGSGAKDGLLTNIPSVAGEAATTAAAAANKANQHLVHGFDPNVHITSGGGMDKEVAGALAAQKHIHLTGAQEHAANQYAMGSGHDSAFANNPHGTYEMNNGGTGISHPGNQRLSDNYVNRFNDWLTKFTSKKKR
ncbi:MAG TPA: hypothetical protein VLF59_05560 [Candidatus Saccharimonadales bacterium]|nr:hypothetical protein [Candidatus Saccharimonadales bacterium]